LIKKVPKIGRTKKPAGKEQFKRFLAMAKETGADNGDQAFESALKRMIPEQRPGSKSSERKRIHKKSRDR
jgi:hypothetical protein